MPVTASIPAKFSGRARRDAAAFYLSQLARGVLAGEVSVVAGDRQTPLATSEFLILEIEVTQKKRANHVQIKLRWPTREPSERDPARVHARFTGPSSSRNTPPPHSDSAWKR